MTSSNARLEGGLVTYGEAAELVGVKVGTVRGWVHKGWLKPFDDVRPMRFHTVDVYRCERERRHAATVPLHRLAPPPGPCEGHVSTVAGVDHACKLLAGHAGKCMTGWTSPLGSQRHASVDPSSPKIG